MHAHEFLTSVTIIVAIMGLIALVELIQPMFRRSTTQGGRSGTNLGMTVLTLTLNWALTAAAALFALALPLLNAPGVMARLGIPIAAQIVAGVIVLDFTFGYLAHWAMHMSPLLWRVHCVHHADPFVDVTPTCRHHPIARAWRFLFVIIPVWGLGLAPDAVSVHPMV